jgi:DNA replication regulator DPB11
MAAHNAADFDKFSLDDLKRGYLVIPHDVQSDPTSLPTAAETMALVTNWWVEQCLYSKSLVDPTEHVLCRPFGHLAINGRPCGT